MGSTKEEVETAYELCLEYFSFCDWGPFDHEYPVHTVALDSFWIDRTEVTNAQYRRCVESGICLAPMTCSFGEPSYEDESKTDHPVVCVDWYGAQRYCEWAGGRLPTEAEWEYAARGPEGYTYPWGNDAPSCDKANYRSCVGDTAAVDVHPAGASWCGAEDMAGNVHEWVGDWYGLYPSERQVNPKGPPAGDNCMARGGGWLANPNYMRAADRSFVDSPDHSDRFTGFRCVKEE
jgi:formylglycine-generating enzyme required for sulfatase activity